MSRLTTTLILCALLVSAQGFCISRIGNNRFGDKILGFDARIPDNTISVRGSAETSLLMQLTTESADVMSPLGTGIGAILPTLVQASAFSAMFPELASETRAEFQEKLHRSGAGWKRMELAGIPSCVELYTVEATNAFTVLALWGPKTGLSLVASRGHTGHHAVEFILKSLQLDPGACQWK